MSNRSGLAAQFVNDTTPSTVTEALARPKVMRRPAHFSTAPDAPSPRAQPVDDERITTLPAPVSAPTVSSRIWQDDARFGTVMLLIVVLVNMGLMVWLPHIRVPVASHNATIEQAAPITQDAAPVTGVTLYTKPAPAAHALPSVEAPVTVHILGDAGDSHQ